MNLTETFQAIKEERLDRTALEKYEQELSAVYADMMVEIGRLKKARALYFYSMEQEHPELPDIKIRRVWDATDDGMKLIQYENEVKAVAKMLSSIKSRIYQTY